MWLEISLLLVVCNVKDLYDLLFGGLNEKAFVRDFL